MLPDYQDIVDIAGPPMWWDQDGVPRYQEFSPDMLGVYNHFALLVTIECQSCRQQLLVGCGWNSWGTKIASQDMKNLYLEIEMYSLAKLANEFQYGDPPRHECSGAGETMSSVSIQIEQAWHREGLAWIRDHDIEKIDILPDWDR